MLTQEGFRIAETRVLSQTEDTIQTSTARFYCFSKTTPPIIVEIARWRTNGEMLVAQLRYSEALRVDLRQELESVKNSLMCKSQPTLGFGAGLKRASSVSADAFPSPAPEQANGRDGGDSWCGRRNGDGLWHFVWSRSHR